MPKLRVLSGAELCDFLSEHGFERVRQRGGHVIMRRGQVSFPVPLHRQLDRGTMSGMERAGRATCTVTPRGSGE
jgi:predicted RNA binding protein YcfA (HicA-like mRNA interferase family)